MKRKNDNPPFASNTNLVSRRKLLTTASVGIVGWVVGGAVYAETLADLSERQAVTTAG